MTVKDRYTGIQDLFKVVGSDGCLFLSLCSIIEEVNEQPVDIIDVLKTSIDNKWVDEKMYVLDSLALLGHWTNKKWARKEVASLGIIRDNDYTIAKWYNSRTGFTHFRRRGWDTVVNSQTVKQGKLKGYYIYTYEV